MGIDLIDLYKLTEGNQPRKRLLRVQHRAKTWYLTGYASKARFDTGVYSKGEVTHKSCIWVSVEREKKSKCREAKNITQIIESMVEYVMLHDSEVFVIINNSVF